ncbi:MAG: hypothetical protein ACJAZ3_002002 [Sphingobacteriales bacterium]|jgi:hypothetical protein
MSIKDTLSQLIEDNKSFLTEIEEVISKFSDEQFNWKPIPEKWSAGQIVQHLFKSDGLYMANIYGSIIKKSHLKSDNSKKYSLGLMGKFMINSVVNPNRKSKMKTMKMFKPTGVKLPISAFNEFKRQQNTFIDQMKESVNLDLKRIKVASPASRLIQFSLIDCYNLNVKHNFRHLNQLKELITEPAFPKQITS